MNIFESICSPEFLFMWIRVATPILLTSLGAVICSKAGVVNLGLEGTMLMGAVAGYVAVVRSGSLWLGVLAALVCRNGCSAAEVDGTLLRKELEKRELIP